MTIVVLPQAADEFDGATANYEDQQADLGRRFSRHGFDGGSCHHSIYSSQFDQTMITLSLRLPDSLHRAIKKLATKEGHSMNQFLIAAAAEKLSPLENKA